MILLVQDRKNNHHLVDYCAPHDGRKFTICGLAYSKKEIINIIALDNTIHNICKTCYLQYEDEFQELLDNYPREAKGKLLAHLRSKYRDAVIKIGRKSKKWFLTKRYRYPITRLKTRYQDIKSGIR